MKTIPELSREYGVGEHVIRRMVETRRLATPPRVGNAFVFDAAAEADLVDLLKSRGLIPAQAETVAP